MWHPKQHLHSETVAALFMGRFTAIEIEFLGWLSYNAAALNNSRNPVKAAHTILAKANDPDSKMHRMLMLFAKRKEESVKPTEVETHEVADQVFDNLKWMEREALTVGVLNSKGEGDAYINGGISDGETSINSEDREHEGEEIQDTQEDYDE
jgi:hypothetical protein